MDKSSVHCCRSDAEQEQDDGTDLPIINVWILSPRVIQEIMTEVRGDSTEPLAPALCALFRGDCG